MISLLKLVFNLGGIMQIKNQLILKEIEPIEEFKSTYYHPKLNLQLIKLCKEKDIKLYESEMHPMISQSINLMDAIANQYFELDIGENEPVIMSCNPFNLIQQNKYKNWSLLLTTPCIFIQYLANQLSHNMIEGLFKLIHIYAGKNKISDIHLSTNKQYLKIQFNSIGKQTFSLWLSDTIGKKLIHYIKLISHIETSVTNKPQDGSYKFNHKKQILEVRSATLPILGGEMISLRLFYPNQNLSNLNQLGFSNNQITAIKEMSTEKYGLILITGPTGSGKSTTLYTILKNLKSKHIITIEDPIEQIIESVHQTNINTNQNYTLKTAFKAVLRHNPEVIAIGEIRDSETADIVLNAAYSGHLIIASLHTNNIESTLLRLANLGCNPFMISYCLRGIISQELAISTKNQIILSSSILHCKTPFIIHDIKKELPNFLEANKIIK